MLRAVAASKPTAVYTLAQSAVAVSCPADTTEDTLATVTIPAGLVGPNSRIEIHLMFTLTNNANNKTIKAHLGGAAGTVMASSIAASVGGCGIIWVIANRGATNSQVAGPSNYGVAGGVPTSATVDMSVSQDLVITAQKAVSTDTMTLESYAVKVCP